MTTYKNWHTAVYQACLAEVDQDKCTFSRKSLMLNHLDSITTQTNSRAKTPHQSLSRVLQELRDYGFVKFISNGQYQLVKKEIDIQLLCSNKKMSRGEKMVAMILDGMNIPYKRESTHSDLKHKGYLRFDFEIKYGERKFVIEVDGIQHDRPVDYFGGVDAFVIRKKCDQIKNDYCKRTGRAMLRIKASALKFDIVKEKIVKLLDS